MKLIKSLFDDRTEIVGWLAFALACTSVMAGFAVSWQQLLMLAWSMLTILGSASYKGISIGPRGLDIGGSKPKPHEADGPLAGNTEGGE